MMNKQIFMIIDDDADDRTFFKEALKKMHPSYVCLEANGGFEALQELRKAKKLPNFIFLDINMPRMDGRECLKELKKDAKLTHIPVIMYSTSFTDKSIADFRKLGASSHLNKPSDIKKLPELILIAMTKSIKLG